MQFTSLFKALAVSAPWPWCRPWQRPRPTHARHQDHRAGPARRRHRPHRPRRRRQAGASHGPAGHRGQPPGASNNLGTDVLAKSAPDGYTIGIVGGSHNTNKFLFRNLGWDPEKSFEPIVYTHEVPLVFAIYPQIPAKTLPELVAWMKANPCQRLLTLLAGSRTGGESLFFCFAKERK
jgi:hypothetical protein